jgi:hypothetical protein
MSPVSSHISSSVKGAVENATDPGAATSSSSRIARARFDASRASDISLHMWGCLYVSLCVRVRVRVCVCVCARARACVCVCVCRCGKTTYKFWKRCDWEIRKQVEMLSTPPPPSLTVPLTCSWRAQCSCYVARGCCWGGASQRPRHASTPQ